MDPEYVDWGVGQTMDDHDLSQLHSRKPSISRFELRTHARFIRDSLPHILGRQPQLSSTDEATLRMIFDLLGDISITVDLLRFSRMEKALQLVAETRLFPPAYAKRAADLLVQWEDQLGSLKNITADLWGPGGRLQGVKRIKVSENFEDDSKSAWEVEAGAPDQAYEYGNLGFEVGQWWLKPAAAYRDGIIDDSPHAISANGQGAYAILLTRNYEQALKPNGQFVYHVPLDDPNKFMLSKTMTNMNEEDKVVRVLRSSKLRSKLAPKAGVRYDGLYRVTAYGIKLVDSLTWRVSVTLSRVPNQPPIVTALPSDMIDDWRDYQHLKLKQLANRDDDFHILREIARGPARPQTVDEVLAGATDIITEEHNNLRKPARPSVDSGYSSRKSSEPAANDGQEVEFRLVAEGTPTPGSTLDEISYQRTALEVISRPTIHEILDRTHDSEGVHISSKPETSKGREQAALEEMSLKNKCSVNVHLDNKVPTTADSSPGVRPIQQDVHPRSPESTMIATKIPEHSDDDALETLPVHTFTRIHGTADSESDKSDDSSETDESILSKRTDENELRPEKVEAIEGCETTIEIATEPITSKSSFAGSKRRRGRRGGFAG